MHLHGQKFRGVLEKFSCTSSFFWSKMQKTTFLKINGFLSEMVYQFKMQAATNSSSHLRKHQTFQFFQTTDFFMQFSKITFFRDFLKSSVAHVKSLYEIDFMSILFTKTNKTRLVHSATEKCLTASHFRF